MLPLLNQDAQYSYRIPYTLTNESDPYILAAYLAAMRFSSRFDEAQGSLAQYLRFYGYEPDYHVGSTTDRMRNAMIYLCANRILQGTQGAMKRLKPHQSFSLKFNPGWGWRFRRYPLCVLFQIREIDRAANRAKRRHWGSQDSLIELLHLTAHLRAYMEPTTDSVAPIERWNSAVGIIDLQSSLAITGLTEKRFMFRLDRIQEAALGVYQRVDLIGRTRAESQHIIIFVNHTPDAKHNKLLRQTRDNLRSFYKNSELIER